MTQYIVTATDYSDENALGRRLEARPRHFERVRSLRDGGNFIFGGAILDDAGNMCGSSLIMQFSREEDLLRWLSEEPYMIERVWEKVEWKRFKVAVV